MFEQKKRMRNRVLFHQTLDFKSRMRSEFQVFFEDYTISYQNPFILVVRVQQQHRRFLGAPYSICIDDNDHEYGKKNRTYRYFCHKNT